MIKVGSDFSGIGAFDSALKSLNIPFANIYACDIDKFAKKSYLANHTADDFYSDVYDRPIPQDSLDIYMTSPPCQAFSTAGKMQGEQDKRGILFYNSLEFIKTNKPKVFIIENVKGLISTDGGAIFTKWIDSLCGGYANGVDNSLVGDRDAPPYNLHYKVLNSKDYGVAQSRERIFIVGIRTDIDFDYEFPAPTDNSKRLKDFLQNEVDEKYYLSGARLKVIADWEVEHKAKGNTGLKFGLKHPDEVGGGDYHALRRQEYRYIYFGKSPKINASRCVGR